MAELLVSIQHRTAEGKTTYFSTSAEVDAEDFEEEVSEAAGTLLDVGFCVETEPDHYVFVPPHAIYRADFELIREPKK